MRGFTREESLTGAITSTSGTVVYDWDVEGPCDQETGICEGTAHRRARSFFTDANGRWEDTCGRRTTTESDDFSCMITGRGGNSGKVI